MIIDILAPLNMFQTLSQGGVPEFIPLLVKFNVVLMILIAIIAMTVGRFNIKQVLICIPIAIVLAATVDKLGSMLGLSNPQQITVYPLTFITAFLCIQVCVKKYRTLHRIFMSLVTVGIFVGFALIHVATLNIKTYGASHLIAEHNYTIISSTFANTPEARQQFEYMCKLNNLYCRHEAGEVNYNNSGNVIIDIDGVLSDYGMLDLSNADESLKLITNLNDLRGSVHQVFSVKQNGIERTIVAVDSISKAHEESKFIIYYWVLILSSFWLYGGLIGIWYHSRKQK